MKTEGVTIQGVGSYLPRRRSVSDAVAAGDYDPQEAAAAAYIEIAVADEESAPEMALTAARTALTRAGISGSTVTHLLYADCYHAGPDGWPPHSYLHRHLLTDTAFTVGVERHCNGVFAALELAAALLVADPAAVVLVASADNFMSPLVNRWAVDDGVVLADGASAVVLSRAMGFAELRSVASITLPELEGAHRGDRPLWPADVALGRPLDFRARFAEFAAAQGFGPAAGLRFVRALQGVVEQVLDEAGVGLTDLARVAFTHAGLEILTARLAAVGVPLELSTWDIGRRTGHAGASDQLIALDELVSHGELGAQDNLLMVGVGPGVNISAAVVGLRQDVHWRSTDMENPRAHEAPC